MRPLTQNFLVNEPANGVDLVYVKAIDLFFRSKPSNSSLGIEVQLRDTAAGIPQSRQIPYASKTVSWADVNVSTDGSVATRFEFDNLVPLRPNELIGLAVIPMGGTPGYKIWTARRDDTDTSTGTKIVFPNNIGDLFAASNDLTYTKIINTCVKFSLITANFSSSGTARYVLNNVEFVRTRPPVGSFTEGELVYVSNNVLNIASVAVSMGTPFTNGEIVVQPNTANLSTATAYGTVYFSNTTLTLLANTVGKFTNAAGLLGISSSITTGTPSLSRTNAVTTAACTAITVPSISIAGGSLAVNQFMYVAKSNYSNTHLARITAVNTATGVVTLNLPVPFADVDAVYGQVKSDGNLTARFAQAMQDEGVSRIMLRESTANNIQNFANVSGQLLIGATSRATASVDSLVNPYFDSVTLQTAPIEVPNASLSFGFFSSSNGAVRDSNLITAQNETPYETTDYQRVIYSRSNEWAVGSFPVSRSFAVEAAMTTANPRTSPYVDYIKSNIMVSSNDLMPEQILSGYHLAISGANGVLASNTVVWQSNATSNTTARVVFSNSTFVSVYDTSSSNAAQLAQFTANTTSTITDALTGVRANVTAVTRFNESYGNGKGTGHKSPSRYVSKTVLLADSQDSEDLVVFLSAYRPSGTNIKVFAKLLNAVDSDPFDVKSWTPMIDTSNTLFSSSVNVDDLVELKYVLPSSTEVHNSGITVSNTSTTVSFGGTRTTEQFTPGSYIYAADNTLGTFSVRRVVAVPNTSALVISSNASFSSSNASIGYISDSVRQCNAFKYTNNSNIVRYVCTSTDSVFRGYKKFAIKIVLTSNETFLVPRVGDMRALALQI